MTEGTTHTHNRPHPRTHSACKLLGVGTKVGQTSHQKANAGRERAKHWATDSQMIAILTHDFPD